MFLVLVRVVVFLLVVTLLMTGWMGEVGTLLFYSVLLHIHGAL